MVTLGLPTGRLPCSPAPVSPSTEAGSRLTALCLKGCSGLPTGVVSLVTVFSLLRPEQDSVPHRKSVRCGRPHHTGSNTRVLGPSCCVLVVAGRDESLTCRFASFALVLTAE